jgi:hypothetical protein
MQLCAHRLVYLGLCATPRVPSFFADIGTADLLLSCIHIATLYLKHQLSPLLGETSQTLFPPCDF